MYKNKKGKKNQAHRKGVQIQTKETDSNPILSNQAHNNKKLFNRH